MRYRSAASVPWRIRPGGKRVAAHTVRVIERPSDELKGTSKGRLINPHITFVSRKERRHDLDVVALNAADGDERREG